MKKLLILRHGKAESRSLTNKDFDRKLSDKGHLQVKSIAKHFEKESTSNLNVICSSAQRTRETLKDLLVNVNFKTHSFTEDLYHASHKDLLNVLHTQSENEILIVGHNNGISDLVYYLTGENVRLSTCQLAVMDLEIDNWNELTSEIGTLKAVYSPDVLS